MKNYYSSLIISFVFIGILFLIYKTSYLEDMNNNFFKTKSDYYLFKQEDNFQYHEQTRDFVRYNCRNKVRIGGKKEYIQNAPNNLWRIDGAWFICLDESFKLNKNNCLVYSFGINNDYTFDQVIRYEYECNIYSFDPFIEADVFKAKRNELKAYKTNKLEMDKKWIFYRLGISTEIKNENEIGGMLSLNLILNKLTKQNNKIIDIMKIDIEGGEIEIIKKLDMNYACKYIKQFVFETHFNYETSGGKNGFDSLRKLETCFSLFHRDTRFFKGDTYGSTGHMTEFQNPKSNFKINLDHFNNELDLANYLFTTGELYFINRNFI
jgi:predicted small secreted protein